MGSNVETDTKVEDPETRRKRKGKEVYHSEDDDGELDTDYYRIVYSG